MIFKTKKNWQVGKEIVDLRIAMVLGRGFESRLRKKTDRKMDHSLAEKNNDYNNNNSKCHIRVTKILFYKIY